MPDEVECQAPAAHAIHVVRLTPEVLGELTMFMQTVTVVAIVKPKVSGSSETAVVGQRVNAPRHN